VSITITIFSIILTIAVYFFSLKVSKKVSSPFTTPVFFSTVIIILILLIGDVSYEEYTLAKDIMTYLLGPATVALAVPLYKNRSLLGRFWIPAVIGISIGTMVTILSALYIGKMLHLTEWMLTSISIKSVTIPVASELAKIIGGDTILVAGIVMITGMIGAMFGPRILTILNIDHPLARGLSLGSMSHGIGTAEAVREGEIQGAAAGVAMAIAAVFVSIFLPLVLPYFL
jgi:predicted murein hydrolase (TIGR00659 family)